MWKTYKINQNNELAIVSKYNRNLQPNPHPQKKKKVQIQAALFLFKINLSKRQQKYNNMLVQLTVIKLPDWNV